MMPDFQLREKFLTSISKKRHKRLGFFEQRLAT